MKQNNKNNYHKKKFLVHHHVKISFKVVRNNQQKA